MPLRKQSNHQSQMGPLRPGARGGGADGHLPNIEAVQRPRNNGGGRGKRPAAGRAEHSTASRAGPAKEGSFVDSWTGGDYEVPPQRPFSCVVQAPVGLQLMGLSGSGYSHQDKVFVRNVDPAGGCAADPRVIRGLKLVKVDDRSLEGLNADEARALLNGRVWKTRLRGGFVSPVELAFEEDREGFAAAQQQAVLLRIAELAISAAQKPTKAASRSGGAPPQLGLLPPFKPGGGASQGFGKAENLKSYVKHSTRLIQGARRFAGRAHFTQKAQKEKTNSRVDTRVAEKIARKVRLDTQLSDEAKKSKRGTMSFKETAEGKGLSKWHKEHARLQKLADNGDVEAMHNLGILCEYGANAEGLNKNEAQALRWYEMAAKGGLAGAQCDVGRFFATGIVVDRDFAIAAEMFQEAAGQGEAAAQHNLGRLYLAGMGVKTDTNAAAYWFQRAAQEGHAPSQRDLGKLLFDGKVTKPSNTANACYWFAAAADQGDGYSQHCHGFMLEGGIGCDVDEAGAMARYLQAAEQGQAKAQLDAGRMFILGRGVKAADPKQAFQWISQAADQGLSVAEERLGRLYEVGLGCDADHEKALWWYRKAEAQGLPSAKAGLGRMYRDGLGVAEDLPKAVTYLTAACEADERAAQGMLAEMYDTGRGVKQDKKMAKKLYAKAGRVLAGRKSGSITRAESYDLHMEAITQTSTA